jgi:mannose-6-phosphate isomerase
MFKFKPYLKTVVWGGEKIAPFKGIETEQEHIGESWELSGVKGHESVVNGGECDGKTVTELCAERKEWLLGAKVYERTGTEFPLLIKFIDAQSDLSIQVHPDDKLAFSRHDGSKGKTEMWYVVGASEGAHLMSGLSRQITPEEYVKRVSEGTITEVLCDYAVAPGDVFFIPAGRIHAIGAGCFVAEIQQTSDITYRIYDYGRLGLDGKPRELHTELAKDAIDYTVKPDYRTGYQKSLDRESILVRCPYFTTSLFDLTEPFTKDLHNIDSFLTVICVEGSGVLRCVEPAPMREIRSFGFRRRAKALTEPQLVEMPVRQGETVLVPACVPSLEFIPDDAAGCRAIPAAEKNPDGECCRNSIGSPAAPAPHFKLLTSYIA